MKDPARRLGGITAKVTARRCSATVTGAVNAIPNNAFAPVPESWCRFSLEFVHAVLCAVQSLRSMTMIAAAWSRWRILPLRRNYRPTGIARNSRGARKT